VNFFIHIPQNVSTDHPGYVTPTLKQEEFVVCVFRKLPVTWSVVRCRRAAANNVHDHRVPTESKKSVQKIWSFSSLKKYFWSVSVEKGNNFPDLIF